MSWFVWRQHRKQFLILGIFLALFAAVVIPSGLHFWHSYQYTLANCAQNPANPTCSDIADSLFQTTTDKLIIGLVPVTVLFLPILLGVFWGAPLLSKEYAEGTNALVWTQSISRRRWLTTKLIWILAATALFVSAFAALVTWWSNTSNALNMDRFANGNMFGIQGIVPVAIAVFAVSIGIMFGAWFRKVMVAVGVTLAVYVVAAHIVIPNLARPHYVTPVSISTTIIGRQDMDSKVPGGSWIISQLVYNANGQAIYGDLYPAMPAQCQKLTLDIKVPNGGTVAKEKLAGIDPVNDCLNKAGWHQIARYQPSYRYWEFQEIESGIYLAMAALAVTGTYWLVLKRDA